MSNESWYFELETGVCTLKIFNGFSAFVISQALKILKASDVKPYVVFISPPSYDRILTLRRGKVDPFNPQPTAQMSVSVLNPLCNQRSMKPRYTSFIFTCVHCPKCSLRHTFTNFSFQFLTFTFLNIPQWGFWSTVTNFKVLLQSYTSRLQIVSSWLAAFSWLSGRRVTWNGGQSERNGRNLRTLLR